MIRLLVVSALLTPGVVAAAPSSAGDAERLVVTATRLPTPPERVGHAVTVVTAADIRRRQYRSLSAALQGVPGLHVSPSGGRGAQTSVFVRGAESDHVLVLVDGVETSDPASAGFDFGDFQLDDVARIEVVRGAHGAQYGSAAIGGVIHVITRRGAHAAAPALRGRVEAGSFGTEQAVFAASGGGGAFDYSANVSRLYSDGESFTPRGPGYERDGYERLAAGLNAGWRVSDATRFSLSSGYQDFSGDYDAGGGENPASSRRGHANRVALRLDGEYFDGLWKPRWSAAYFSRSVKERNRGARANDSDGRRFKARWQNVFSFGARWRLLAGVESELEKARTGGGFSASARTRAAHAQLEFAPSPEMSVAAGWRNEDADDFASERSYSLSATWTPRRELRLSAAYGTGFKAPSLADRFRDFPGFNFFSNPDLEPETSRSWEAGFDWSGRDWRVGGVYFNNAIRNLIAADASFTTLVNRRRASIEGLESYLAWRPRETFEARLDYTLTSAYDEDHRRLLRRPLRHATLGLWWRPWPDTSLHLQARHVGAKADFPRAGFGRVRKGGYSVFRLSVRHHLRDGIHWLVRASNLFDKDYQPVDGFQGPGVEWFIGLSFATPE